MDVKNASGKIRITPLYGGRSNTAVCSLLELSDCCRLLLDCGLSYPIDYDYFAKITTDLLNNGGLDAIILSHADLGHAGALPILAGQKGFHKIPLICTLPVQKYSQLVLYDFILNQELEGEGVETKRYTLDDIDHAFRNVINLKYSQSYTLPLAHWKEPQHSDQVPQQPPQQHSVTVEALPSGRTIGGAIWRIRCGPAEVLYSMDVNLRKENLLDAVPLDLLPTSPAVMICDATSPSRTTAKKKKEKDETTAMINTILETVREGGNVLIPCETAGRLLELLLVLHKYWVDNRLGLYHLILLSNMANNILEFARYQLEWMSDSLTRGFYNGKANPFDLSSIKCFHDVRHMEKQCYGPKVVIATDSSLSYGLSKELLLKWGGDKRCRVIFIDHDIPITAANYNEYPTRTLSEELKKLALNPPMICSVNIPMKVPLQGQELLQYKEQQEKRKLALEEEILRKKRKEEISRFALAKEEVKEEEEEEEEETDLHAMEIDPSFDDDSNNPKKKQKMDGGGTAGGFFSYLDTNFKQFETKIIHYKFDEYGLSNDDLHFQDIGPTEHRLSSATIAPSTATPAAGITTATSNPATGTLDEETGEQVTRDDELQLELQQLIISLQETPTKLVARKQTVQFTCDFKSFNFTGKVNCKAIRDFIHHINPKRLFLLSGQESDFQQFEDYYSSQSSSMEVYTPSNHQSIEFEVFTQSLKIQIPRKLVPLMIKVVQTTSEDGTAMITGAGGSAGGGGSAAAAAGMINPLAAFSSIALLKGSISTTESLTNEGVRLIKYVGEKRKKEETQTIAANLMEISGIHEEQDDDDEEDAAPLIIPTAKKEEDVLDLPIDETIGVVSFKEITLMHVKQQLDLIGMKTDFHPGGILICNEQVIIRTDVNNHFQIEGPPIKAFFDVRKVLYQQFAFI